MEPLTLEQFGQTIKKKYPAYASYSDSEIGQRMLEKYPQYSDRVKKARTAETKYEVPRTPETQAAKMAKLQSEQAMYDAEAKKANSFTGKLANFGKAFVSNIAAPEVGLGKTIGGAFATSANADRYTESITKLQGDNATLIKRISAKEKAGQDATKEKQIYNDNIGLINQFKGEFGDIQAPTQKSNLQVAGEIGGTALDVLTAGTYGKAKTAGMGAFKLAPKANVLKTAATAVSPEIAKIGEIASKPKGLFTAQGVKNIAKGTGVGYATDVAYGAQQGETGPGLFVPGVATAAGFTIPALSESIQSLKNRKSATYIATQKTNALRKVAESKSNIRNYVSKQEARGFDPAKEVAAIDDLWTNAVDNTGTIRTKQKGGAVEIYNNWIRPYEDEVSKKIEAEGRSIPVEQIERKLTDAVNSSGMKGASRVNALSQVGREVEGYRLDALPDGTIPVKVIHDAKVDKYANVNYLNESGRVDKTIAKSLKEMVEDNTISAPVKAMNGELSKHFANIGYLEALDGTKIEGGRLGKHFARTIGAIVGSHFGPLGAIVGAEVSGGIKGLQMSRSLSGKTGGAFSIDRSAVNAAEAERAGRKLLPPGPPKGTSGNPLITPPPAEPKMQVVSAKSFVERNPKTGKFFKGYTTEAKGTKTETLVKTPQAKPPAKEAPNVFREVDDASKYKSAEEFVKAKQDVNVPQTNVRFSERLKEGSEQMDGERISNDAKHLSYGDFVKKYEAYNIDGGGMSSGNKPAHAVISKGDLFPSEYDSWDQFTKNEAGVTNKYSNKKGVELAGNYYNKSFQPPLVEKVGNEYAVIDGHHRVANLFAEGQDQVPVYFDRNTLKKMWEEQNGKKVAFQEVKDTYERLFPRIKSKQELTDIWEKAQSESSKSLGNRNTPQIKQTTAVKSPQSIKRIIPPKTPTTKAGGVSKAPIVDKNTSHLEGAPLSKH